MTVDNSWQQLTTVDNSWQLLSIQVHQPMLYQSIRSETTVFTIDITNPKWRTCHGQRHKNCHSHGHGLMGLRGVDFFKFMFFPALLIMFGFWFTSCYGFSIYSTYHDVSWIMALILTCFSMFHVLWVAVLLSVPHKRFGQGFGEILRSTNGGIGSVSGRLF